MPNKLNEIHSCEVCGNDNLRSVLDLGLHPMCDDLVPVGDDRVCREYPIEILYCDVCATAHQRFQVPKAELFPNTYHYRSQFTADVLRGMADLVKSCEQDFGAFAGRKVLDVGCNDGSLLDMFRERGAITLGLEPTNASEEAGRKGHITFNAFLTPEVAASIVASHGKPDFITFTNVFAHIEDLHGVVESLRCLMAPQTVIIIENHYLGAILDKNQFDTFYHEHPRTYSYTSFTHIARSLGVSILQVEFPSRYGGNIRVFLGNAADFKPKTPPDLDALAAREQRFTSEFPKLSTNLKRWQNRKAQIIKDLVQQHGRLRAKAFPGRAAILIKLLGLNEESILAVHEKPGSPKIGHYVPGTRIPIVSDDELFALPDQNQPLVNLAWHIPNEIHSYLQSHGYAGPIIDILNNADFA